MSGYAAGGRITSAEVHLRGAVVIPDDHGPRLAVGDGPEIVDLDDRPAPDPFLARLRAWVAEAGEFWSQTTFYIFDPDSWR